MSENKKTEEQLRQEIIDEYYFDEDDQRIDKILEIKKDRYTATQAKKKALKQADDYKKGKEYYKGKAGIDPKGANQEPKKADSSGDKTQISLKDQYALLGAKVHIDDIDEVVEWAKSKYDGDVSKALGDSKLKAVLSVNEEERTTNDATNTSKSRKGTGQVSPEKLLKDFEKGILPESDEDMEKLAQARLKAKENA